MISHISAQSSRVCVLQLHGGHLRHALHDGAPRPALGLSRHRVTAGSVTDRVEPTRTSGLTPGMTKTALRKMPKAELEDEMKLLSIDTQGTKQDLVERAHAYLSTEQALTSLKSDSTERTAAPEGWLFEAGVADTDLPPDIEALLEQQAQQQAEGSPNTQQQENPEGEDLLTYGQEYTPDQLEGLPKKELQGRLTQRGLAKSGTKAELAQRLHAALAEEQEAVLQDQLEAQDELQRQFEESMMSTASRVETAEQQGVSQPVSDPESDSIDEWPEDDEAEYQSPEDDGELSFEDSEAAGATLGTVRDQEGNVLMGRFNRPRIMMDMFEYQGTKAAELAGEDYAAHNRGAGEYAQSQGVSGEGSTFQPHSRAPLDSQDGEDIDAVNEDEDLFGTDNELEDGFSMAPDQEDGFDSDAEERLEREAEGKRMLLENQPATGGYNSHRNYQNLSARSPDTIEEEYGILDAIISQQPAESPSDPYSGPVSLGPRVAISQAGPVTSQAPNTLSRRVPKGQEIPSKSAAAAVVASQGTSSLDFGTAKDWMALRLPEAARLGMGVTADQLVPEPSASLAQAPEAETSTSSTAGSNLSGVAGTVAEAVEGSMQAAGTQPQPPPNAEVSEPQGKEDDEADWLAAALAASRLDTDLLDELVESVLGQPDASADQAAAEQLLSMEADIQDRLDGVSAEVPEASVVAPEDQLLGDSAEVSMSATTRSSSIDEDQVLPSSAAAEDALAGGNAEQSASGPGMPLPEEPLLSLDTVLEAADSVAATAAQEISVAAAMPSNADQGSEFDELLIKAASEEVTAEALEAGPAPPEDSQQEVGPSEAGIDEAREAALQASEGSQQDSTSEDAPSPFSPALSQTQTDPAEVQHSSIAAEQLDTTITEINEAVADEPATPGQPLPTNMPLASAAADSRLASDAPASSTGAGSGSHAYAPEGSAADSLNANSISSMGNQQELTALRAEMAQKQSALAELQGQVAAVGRSSEGNSAQIAALQEAMAGLQSQRLDLQRADLSGRLAVLQDIAARASLTGAAKDDLQQQLQSMRDEMSQLEADLSTRDMEAASLSRKLAHARAKLGDPAAAPPANGIGQTSVPGAMHARLGLGGDLDLSVKHSLDGTDSKAPLGNDTSHASNMKAKQERMQPGTVVAAGLVEAFKAIGGMFNRSKRGGSKAETDECDSGKR